VGEGGLEAGGGSVVVDVFGFVIADDFCAEGEAVVGAGWSRGWWDEEVFHLWWWTARWWWTHCAAAAAAHDGGAEVLFQTREGAFALRRVASMLEIAERRPARDLGRTA